MEKFCILSDFDGTVTNRDALYSFISKYAVGDWQGIEKSWADGCISSKECLIKEFALVPNMSEELIGQFVDSVQIDGYFKNFYKMILEKNIDLYIVSDGVDYFINQILQKYDIQGLKIISNHGEFRGETFELTFPNDSSNCPNNAGTCKCHVAASMREKYEKIVYIGDGVSDYCVADEVDVLFAKSRLAEYCDRKNIKYILYNNFNDIIQNQIFS